MFEIRIADDHNAGLKHIANLHSSLLSLRFLSELNRCRLHLKFLHLVNIEIR